MEPSKKYNIKSITLDGVIYSVGTGTYPDCFEKITLELKDGGMGYQNWYQLWYKGRVQKEINASFVIAVDYETPSDEDLPF